MYAAAIGTSMCAALISDKPVKGQGLIVLPYFMGERSPIWDSDAKGTIVGLSLAHTKAHLYRAFLEAVAYSLRDAMNATGENLGQSILLAGGVMLAGIGTGLLTYEEVKTWQVLDQPLMPDPDRHAQYDRCFAVYKSIYQHLKDDMKTLSSL